MNDLAPTDPPTVATKRRDRSWVALVVAVVFVVGVAALFAHVMRDSYQASAEPAFKAALVDNFDRRADRTSLGAAADGTKWVSVRGLWAVDAGRAVLAFPATEPNLATIGSFRYASISATVSGKHRCGVVARYADERNYLTLIQVPKYAVWNLEQVKDGQETVLAKLPDIPDQNVGIRLETGSRVVTAMVGLQTATVVLPTELSAAPVGFIGIDKDATGCTWDDLWVYTGT